MLCLCKQGDGGYETKQSTIRGGWDKCLGPFDHYQAKAFGIDVWDCHNNNCYIRKDHNGGTYVRYACAAMPAWLLSNATQESTQQTQRTDAAAKTQGQKRCLFLIALRTLHTLR